jgi:hypothetical protein
MDYSLLVGVHHKDLGDIVDLSAIPRQQQQQQQQQRQHSRQSADEEQMYEERGRRVHALRRDDGGVQGADPNEVNLARDVPCESRRVTASGAGVLLRYHRLSAILQRGQESRAHVQVGGFEPFGNQVRGPPHFSLSPSAFKRSFPVLLNRISTRNVS